MILLKVEKLEVVYHRVITAVQGISLEVPQGAIVTLIGNNGAGKTTTLRALSGFLGLDDARVTEGAIVYRGERIENRAPHRIARLGVALVPERSKVFESLSVEENLLAVVPRRATKFDRELVYQFFPALVPLRRRAAGYLSGGERQMLAIGAALACSPELLLIDELSQGLSPVLVQELMERLKTIRAESGVYSSGRAECAGGARRRRLRLRDGERPHRARRHARAPARASGHPGVLSRNRRRRPRKAAQLPRREAVPQEPALVWLSSCSSPFRFPSAA